MNIDKEKNDERAKLLMSDYIGFKDPKSLTFSPKLKLNKTDDDLYRSYLLQFIQPPNPKKLPHSNQLVLKGYNYFKSKFSELNFTNGEEIVDFIEEIVLDKLIFNAIIVDDLISAYRVLETVNARGISLTTTDLLKNYLFSLLPSEIDI